jgi:hypothetical protein
METKMSFDFRIALNAVHSFPYISGTVAATHLPEIADTLGQIGNKPLNQAQQQAVAQEGAEGNPLFTTVGAAKAAGTAVVAYLALGAFSQLSLYVNGAVGIGKVALAGCILVTTRGAKEYKDAQNLLEKGLFHLIVAVEDFVIGYFALTRAVVALAIAVCPEYAKELSAQVFTWKGAIQHGEGEAQNEAAAQKNRQAYAYNQWVADQAQCFLMPDLPQQQPPLPPRS